MTGQEWINKQIGRLQVIDVAQVEAAADTHEKMLTRIFESGENASGANIGNYDTVRELYVNPNSPSVRKKFGVKGKTGKTKFKNGEPHKTRFFENYNQFQNTQPFASSSVNLRLTNRLYSDFANSLTIREKFKVTTGVKDDENVGKVEGAIAKYGDMFRLTEDEKKHYIATTQKKVIEVLTRD